MHSYRGVHKRKVELKLRSVVCVAKKVYTLEMTCLNTDIVDMLFLTIAICRIRRLEKKKDISVIDA